jgi:hypothetical protein
MGPFRIVDPPTPEDAAAVRQVLAAYRFPWEWAIADNVRATGEAVIPIGFDDKPHTLGYYRPTVNTVDVDPIAAQGLDRMRQTLAHELGHHIDDTVLSHDTRTEIHALMHDGSSVALADCPADGTSPGGRQWPSGAIWRGGQTTHQNRPSEAFANLAPHIWCPRFAKPMGRYGPHRFTHADRIGELVMADAQQHPPFDDIEGTTHEQSIRWLARHGIAFGKDSRFEPNEPVTRGQMAAFLHRYAGAFGLDG